MVSAKASTPATTLRALGAPEDPKDGETFEYWTHDGFWGRIYHHKVQYFEYRRWEDCPFYDPERPELRGADVRQEWLLWLNGQGTGRSDTAFLLDADLGHVFATELDAQRGLVSSIQERLGRLRQDVAAGVEAYERAFARLCDMEGEQQS